MNENAQPAVDPDEHYFVALVNEALALGDLRSARAIAAQYASAQDTARHTAAHNAESRRHRIARHLHLAA
ncbi:hypothetical protein FHP29_12745 [Nocardioides albidus]|uniref:Uncharacterized protein n=1 Tax=Nocardioides albidus TaxID=1517589 RepID=A0A5C4VV79_9ACTN|nr:hypothetical protein [Nocardioides albidus]TNM39727.1 hypothetical protein FHP29_12745 [Nocardioides albidus]